MWATLTERRICVLGAFVVVATSSNTIVVVSGFGAASGNWGRHRLLHYKGQMRKRRPERNRGWMLDLIQAVCRWMSCEDNCYSIQVENEKGKWPNERYKKQENMPAGRIWNTYIRLIKTLCRTGTHLTWVPSCNAQCGRSVTHLVSQSPDKRNSPHVVTCCCRWSFLLFLAAADCLLNVRIVLALKDDFGFPQRKLVRSFTNK